MNLSVSEGPQGPPTHGAGVLAMRYDLEADWHLLNTCNYRCKYCFFSADVLGDKLRTFASPQSWRSAFDATGKIWLLHMTGGEPSIYPQFVEFCETLTERHYMSLNSNLTHSSYENFAQRIDPSRVNFINAGLHLEEREERSGVTKFLRHAELLRSKGFSIIVSLVATPTALERFAEAIALLKPINLFPIPKLLRGRSGGQVYPKAYTELDRRRFRGFSAQAREFYRPILARMAERPSIDMFHDDKFLGGVPSFHGSTCDAGHLFVKIKENGDVFRCSTAMKLGNVLEGTFAARPAAAPCNTNYCFYFCRKYARGGKEIGSGNSAKPPAVQQLPGRRVGPSWQDVLLVAPGPDFPVKRR